MSDKVLVSACLLGARVRYHGGSATCDHPILSRWVQEGRVVSLCPEVDAGLGVPRPPVELASGRSGLEVLHGGGRAITNDGRDVSSQLVTGAQRAVDFALKHGIRVAVLKEGSPSCGSSYVYDGTFKGVRVGHQGVTAAALTEAGVEVFSEAQLEEAEAALARGDPLE